MKVHEYPLMHEFLYGAFAANSGGQRDDTGQIECYIPEDTTGKNVEAIREMWGEAEEWLKWHFGWCGQGADQQELKRAVHWLGMEADGGMTVMQMGSDGAGGDTDDYVKAIPFRLLDLYY